MGGWGAPNRGAYRRPAVVIVGMFTINFSGGPRDGITLSRPTTPKYIKLPTGSPLRSDPYQVGYYQRLSLNTNERTATYIWEEE